MRKNQIQLGSAKLEMVRSAPLTGAGGETYIEKVQKQRRNYLVGYSIKPS